MRARSFQKALGLNLKEKSSGRHAGQFTITKRGSSMARSYLYFAALRLIKNDPLAKAWYRNKVDSRAKNKTVIAVMRNRKRLILDKTRTNQQNSTVIPCGYVAQPVRAQHS